MKWDLIYFYRSGLYVWSRMWEESNRNTTALYTIGKRQGQKHGQEL